MAVLALTTGAPDDWRLPFRVIGAAGVVWVAAWLLLVRSRDLALDPGAAAPELAEDPVPTVEGSLAEEPDPSMVALGAASRAETIRRRRSFLRRFVALAIVVTVINLCFQFFRAWMPKMLREEYGYGERAVQQFSVAYYLATDAGCLAVGFLVRWLAGRGWSVHGARMTTFFGCCLLTALSMMAASLPASWMLLAALLVIGFGSLGQFPTYYAFTQELSARQMGKVTGLLSFTFWFVYSMVGGPVGHWIDRTGRFSHVMFVAGLLPTIGLLAMVLLWGTRRGKPLGTEP
jgi:ACS family hexuronate transporter-like MFS transporter